SLLRGRGLTVTSLDPLDTSRSLNEPVAGFPPGYALLLAPALLVTADIWWSTFLLELLFVALFFASWFVILESLKQTITVGVRIFIWFYWAAVYSPVMRLTSSEIIALAFFSAGLASCMALIVHRRGQLIVGLIGGLFAGLSTAVRYAYWPLLIAAPLAL